MSTLDIVLDPKEVLEYVDEMLAWEAVASSAPNLRYEKSHFMRAKPFIHMGGSVDLID